MQRKLSEPKQLLKELIVTKSRNPFEVPPSKIKNSIDKNLLNIYYEPPGVGETYKIPVNWIKEENRRKENEIKLAKKLEGYLDELGFCISRQNVISYVNDSNEPYEDENGNPIIRYNILAEKGKGNHSILFYAHMDTAADWNNGFDVKTKGDRLYGVGAYDMKGGIATILKAVKNVEPTEYKIKIVFGVDEEYWSRGSAKLLFEEKNGFLRDVKAIVVPEVGENSKGNGGITNIVLGRLGRHEIEITTEGIAKHGAKANDPDTTNAITEASKIAIKIEEASKSLDWYYREGELSIQESMFVNYIRGGEGKLTIPAECKLYVDVSLIDKTIDVAKESLEKIINKMLKNGEIKRMPKISVKKRPTEYMKFYCTPKEHPFVKFVANIVIKKFGIRPSYGIGYSVADENRFAEFLNSAIVPVIVIGPLGGNCHAQNEWVSLNSLNELIKLYKEILLKYPIYLNGLNKSR